MARALEAIMKELNSVYNPQREVYNKQINALPGQQAAQMKGLESAKTDAFNQIVTGANRRGVAFGGIPLEEQQSYLGSSYLPAVANLKNRFTQQAGSLQAALQELAAKQRQDAYGIRDYELAEDARQAQLAEARRAAASGGGGSGLDLSSLFNTPTDTTSTSSTSTADTKQYIGNNDYRGRLAYEANQGDQDARVLLKYVGNDGRYDGPVSAVDFQVLSRNGIGGNYYIPGVETRGNLYGGLELQGGGSIYQDTGSRLRRQ